MWVALYGSKIVGLVGLVVEGDEAEIEPIVVNKEYRCKSIGKQLVERVISEAHQIGIKYLEVSQVARNFETIGFFYKLGFVNLGKIEMFMDFTSRRWKSSLKLDSYEFNF